MLQDLRFAVRMSLARPGLAIGVIATFAVGIGSATAMFGVVDAVMLRPLPFKDPQRLVMVWERSDSFRPGPIPASRTSFLAWQTLQSFEHLVAIRAASYTLFGHDEPRRVQAARVSAGFFDVLGVSPAAGRMFGKADAASRSRVAVMSGRLARQTGREDMSGGLLQLGTTSVEVVGVLPEQFRFPGVPADLWILEDVPLTGPESNSISVVGRVRPGVSIAAAQAELDALVGRRHAEGADPHWTAYILPLAREGVTATALRALPILFGAVLLLLVVSCVNAAALLLVRAAARQREFAVRSALGASRGRLARQSLVETTMLASIGGGAGVLIAGWLLLIVRRIGPADLIRLDTAAIDLRAVLFAWVVSILAAAIVSLVPLSRRRWPNLVATLGASARAATSGVGLRRVRHAIIAAEVTLALVLAIAAMLLVRSYLAVQRIDPGIRTAGVLTVNIALPSARYRADASRVAFFDDLLARLRQLPGTTDVALTDNLPLSGRSLFYMLDMPGIMPAPGEPLPQADTRVVSPGYFESLGISLQQGRTFGVDDRATSAPVAIVNERFVRQHFGGRDPIGRRVRRYMDGEPMRRIVGVVGDVRHDGQEQEVPVEMYIPHSQAAPYAVTLVARSASGDPLALADAVKRQIHAGDSALPVLNIRTFDDLRARTLADRRFQTLLLGSFASLAFALAVAGVYGVVAFAVRDRTHEIGLRVALGAQSRDIVRLVARQGLLPVAGGLLIGLAAAAWTSTLLSSLLFGITPVDGWSFAGAAVILLLSAAAACLLPARRASRIDPLEALRVS